MNALSLVEIHRRGLKLFGGVACMLVCVRPRVCSPLCVLFGKRADAIAVHYGAS